MEATKNPAETTCDPIVNCHTHIFKGDQVPPFLSKSFVLFPFYRLIYLPLILSGFKRWFRVTGNIRNSGRLKKYHMITSRLRRPAGIKFALYLLGLWATVQSFFILYDFISNFLPPGAMIADLVDKALAILTGFHLILPLPYPVEKVMLVVVVLLFVKWGRNLLFSLFKNILAVFSVLPGSRTTELFKRYVLLGRFSIYERQDKTWSLLTSQYPAGTKFVVLPMDMTFMGAGALKGDGTYQKQMEQLAEIKDKNSGKQTFYPFVFVDPRRIALEKTAFFNYRSDGKGGVILDPCFIKKYIEDLGFSGFKIYPALGYYPFDPLLLPLWKYAADRQIPITTHCIQGTIFYRGSKKPEWNSHPVFEQSMGHQTFAPLQLLQEKNVDFQTNFTHPMNYLCLLEESLLRKVVGQSGDQKLKDLFGYQGDDQPMTYNLKHLKICLAHYGGWEEWDKYLESDRDHYSSQLVKNPDRGIEFFKTATSDAVSESKLEQIWKYVDWYSIISSIMLQYDNVYADISYIVYDEKIFPLLKHSLQPQFEKLRKKILFGTDFYVVRNHKSEKEILTDLMAGLTEDEFNLIARENPKSFLN
jgi:predicted TIM-barrel fold metal-dependent hydrolase